MFSWAQHVARSVRLGREIGGLMLPWAELTASSPQFWGGIFFLFSLGCLAPALHGGLGLISYLLQRIFSVMANAGDGVSEDWVFTADSASQPAGDPGAPDGHSGTAVTLTHPSLCSANVLNTHPAPGPEPGGREARGRTWKPPWVG